MPFRPVRKAVPVKATKSLCVSPSCDIENTDTNPTSVLVGVTENDAEDDLFDDINDPLRPLRTEIVQNVLATIQAQTSSWRMHALASWKILLFLTNLASIVRMLIVTTLSQPALFTPHWIMVESQTYLVTASMENSNSKYQDLSFIENRILWIYSTAEFTAFFSIVVMHGLRLLCNCRRHTYLYIPKLIIQLSKFNGLELLKLWNQTYLNSYLCSVWSVLTSRSKVSDLLPFVIIQLIGICMALVSPVSLYLRCKKATYLYNISLDFEFVSSLLFLVQLAGLVIEESETKPWDVLSKWHVIKDKRFYVNDIKTLRLDAHFWKIVWNPSIARHLGVRNSIIFVLARMDDGAEVVEAIHRIKI